MIAKLFAPGGWDARPLLRISWSLVLLLACDAGVVSTDAAVPPARVRVRFDLSAGPMELGAIPFPDDLYLDAQGRVSLGALPGEASATDPAMADALRTSFLELDGFSVAAPSFFSLPPGSLDASSLPATPSDSVREDASVFLMDIDSASPAAFQRIPVAVRFDAARGWLALRPHDGHALVPGRRYAAVVTTGVLDDRGAPIGPGEAFQQIRDAPARPSDPRSAEAYDHYSPVLATLASNGVARERVAALAVFTTQSLAGDLVDARERVWGDTRPQVSLSRVIAAGAELDALLGVPAQDLPGVDVEGGVQHAHLAWVVQGSFESPSFNSPQAGTHARFERDSSGDLRVRRMDVVPFTLSVPAGAPVDRLPLVIFQHGLGGERSALFAIADALAVAGFAVLGIDIPYHGMRALSATPDRNHNFGSTPGPDGFGDVVGSAVQLDFFGIVDESGELPAFHPDYPRDVLRQAVVDLMRAVRVVREGDWAAVRATSGLDTLGFDATTQIGFVGVSLGGIIGAMFTASEPEIAAAVLNVPGGSLARLVEGSASFRGSFLPLLLPKLGVFDLPAAEEATFLPEVAVYQMQLDRGDSVAYLPQLAQRPTHVLVQMARDDETVPNYSSEGVARPLGAVAIGGAARYTDLVMGTAPVRENLQLATERVTRAIAIFEPATHGLLSRRSDSQDWEHPVDLPFQALATPVPVANPVDEAVGQIVHYFETWRGAGGPEVRLASP